MPNLIYCEGESIGWIVDKYAGVELETVFCIKLNVLGKIKMSTEGGLFMGDKERLTGENKEALKNEVLLEGEEEKTATDNQWVSVAGYKGYMTEPQEKDATNNQWTSTMKNT